MFCSNLLRRLFGIFCLNNTKTATNMDAKIIRVRLIKYDNVILISMFYSLKYTFIIKFKMLVLYSPSKLHSKCWHQIDYKLLYYIKSPFKILLCIMVY